MLIEDLIFEIQNKKDSLKHINNYIIDEVNNNWCSYKGHNGEIYNKVTGLLHANSVIIESLEQILLNYQEQVDLQYDELLKNVV